MRRIPSTGEAVSAVGLGTWKTFDVTTEARKAPLREVLAGFFAAGGALIDSSPMYGAAESVVGELLSAGQRRQAFLATKVWTRGKAEGEAQMRTSMRRMGAETIDLMQVHNLVDVDVHLATLRDWKARGLVRYVGVTHYDLGAFGDIERLVRTEHLDFIQVPYSLDVREAAQRVLPAAQEHGVAVLVMQPFRSGGLLGALRDRPLPAWAADIDARTWSEVLLKFVLAHPAVTCVIPATSRPEHLAANMRAGTGRLPGPELLRRMVDERAA